MLLAIRQIGIFTACALVSSGLLMQAPVVQAQSADASQRVEPNSASDKASDRLPTLDELLGLTPSKTGKTQPDSKQPSTSDPVKSKLNMNEAAHLFERAVKDMGRAAERLDRGKDAGLATQRVQQSVLAKLDQVISTARRTRQKRQSGQGGLGGQTPKEGSNANVSKPSGGDRKGGEANRPSAGDPSVGHKPKAASSNPLREHRTEWGHLPVRLREQLLQGLGESFSPLYQKMTEEYYRLLAEQENQP